MMVRVLVATVGAVDGSVLRFSESCGLTGIFGQALDIAEQDAAFTEGSFLYECPIQVLGSGYVLGPCVEFVGDGDDDDGFVLFAICTLHWGSFLVT